MANAVKGRRAEDILRTLIVVLIILALATATLFTFAYYNDLHQARLVLYSAKNVRLAAMAVSAEYYADGISLVDTTAQSGFQSAAEEGILKLSQVKGQVRLLQANEKGYEILSFAYREGDYVAIYQKSGGTWRVTKLSALITA